MADNVEEEPWCIKRQRADSADECRVTVQRGRAFPILVFSGHEDAFFGHCTFFLRNRWEEEDLAEDTMSDYQGMMTLGSGARLSARLDAIADGFERTCVEAEDRGEEAPDVPERPYPELSEEEKLRMKAVVLPFVRSCDQAAHTDGGSPEAWERLAGVALGEWELSEEEESWKDRRSLTFSDKAQLQEILTALRLI
eukprot:TRINITY_DN20226_c0_g1_i1.p1 TRINITY_DN20226_c0_g1~~TRINITY_DN20226_c0_g1_i1.p1  ORF type:complete len:196 (+),score=47.25 TRINITY_DN20226_c0_g1_i1:57-644(+)